jgi:hypothetical protein
MVFEFLERIRGNKAEEKEKEVKELLKSARIEEPQEEGIGHRVYRTTHIIGAPAKKERAKPHGLGNGNNKKKKNGIGTGIPRDVDVSNTGPDDKAIIPTLPEGALSVAAGAAPDHERIYIFHWPTMVYIGYDVVGSEEHYEGEYLIMYYKPKLKEGFKRKLTIDAPPKNAVKVVW